MIFLFFALAASFFMAWTIGADSASPSFGPVVSAKALGVLRSSLIVGLSAFLGAFFQGGQVTETIGNRLLLNVQFTTMEAAIILLVAAVMVLLGVWRHYPIPTAFTLVGATLGTGVGTGGELNSPQLIKIFSFWLTLPFIAGAIAFFASKILVQVLKETPRATKILQFMLVFFGIYTSFTAGAIQVGLAVGPLVSSVNINIALLLAFGGVGILLGAWTGSPRIIDAIARDYVDIGPRRSIAALAGTSILAQIASLLGIPISFNQAIVAAMVGSGLATPSEELGVNKIGMTAVNWIGSFLFAFGIAFSIGHFLL